MSKPYFGHLYNISDQDLYNQGIGLSNFYSEQNPNDDGRECKMTVPKDKINHVPVKYFTPKLGINPRQFTPPVIPPRTVEYGYWNYPSTMPVNYEPLQDITSTPIEDTMIVQKKMSRINPDDKKYSDLMKQTEKCAYNEQYFEKPENKLFLQDIEPNVFSYSEVQDPINSNLGISYTPTMPVRVRDQICTPIGSYPLYSRIDPQLVRSDGDIYDSRFSGFGDEYRSYSNIDLGQVGYYYSDIDSVRKPNFIMRNKVDHVDYTDPNDKTSPYYKRNASLDDIRPLVESQWTSDEIFHREDLMERLMRKRNSELYQLRMMPQSRAARQAHPFTVA
jgi:hypothetical protein